MLIELQAAALRHPAATAGAAPALHPLDLRIEPGEQLAVIGPSGAGKTSLMLLLGCALRPSSGRLSLDGQDPWQLPGTALRRLRSRLFLAPQVPPLPPRQRVVTAVLAGRLPGMGWGASLRMLVHARDAAAAQAALARFDLEGKLFDRVDRLSGGERQRVGLARALMADARLLLVDEPLSALDPSRAAQAMQVLVDDARSRGATLVASLHDVPAALRHFPRILGLREGRLQFDLPPQDVTPARLAALYGDEPPGPPPAFELPDTTPAPVVVMCR
ncbi:MULTISPECIES: ATP-binding cassette domain-containing protein [Ramlibacter]|uniref:ATP-binding cassette domain-containing protein n=1 Tax=Ramlibacter aquaticus TaxID=2780094 RepID=A0ABR9SD71_9BURK|nr:MULTISPECIES: ATP-binding cassette domain-containing protein [Ramlibacter]MBE7940301.1 ATP-binding cassette domain-containing protein [Ramlibacter aquaticus]